MSAVKVISGFVCAIAIFAVLGIDYFILHSHLAYFLFFLTFLILSAIELCKIAGVKSRWAIGVTVFGAGVIYSWESFKGEICGAIPVSSVIHQKGLFVVIDNSSFLTLVVIVLLLLPLVRPQIRLRTELRDVAVSAFTIMYVGMFGSYLARLLPFRIFHASEGWSHALLLWFICTAKANDILGYLIGSSIGKHPLHPVSPKKTVEGAVAGLIGGVLISLLVVYLFLSQSFSWQNAVLFGIIVGVAAQLGDLAESYIKRLCDVKDSGNLIPGSGGALDFIDCLLFAAPAAYYFLFFSL